MNWLELFGRDRRPRQTDFQDFGRFVEDNAFGGNQTREGQRRQEDFQSGFGGNPPDRRNYQPEDEWIYPQTSRGKSGDIRIRPSGGTNGVLRNADGQMLFVQRRKRRKDGTYYWEDVRDSRDAQELLSQYVRQDAGGEQGQSERATEPEEPSRKGDRGEGFEEIQYQPRNARSQDPKVEEVQRTLQQLGYPVDPDGYYGDETKRAVRQFIEDQRRDPQMRMLVPSPEQNDGSRVNSILYNLMKRRAADSGGYGGSR